MSCESQVKQDADEAWRETGGHECKNNGKTGARQPTERPARQDAPEAQTDPKQVVEEGLVAENLSEGLT